MHVDHTVGESHACQCLHRVHGVGHDLRDQLLDDVITNLTAILTAESNDSCEPIDAEDIIGSCALVSAMRYIKRDYAFFDAITSNGNGCDVRRENAKHQETMLSFHRQEQTTGRWDHGTASGHRHHSPVRLRA